MEVSSVTTYMSENLSQSTDTKVTKKTSGEATTATVSENAAAEKNSKAVVVEKSSEQTKATYSKKSSKVDSATIERLKQEAEEKTAQLRTIVEKLLLKQSKTYNSSMDIYSLIKNGELEVDEETRLQAQKDIAEDGYWGVEQTSDRMVSFATALAGNDPEQADKMIEAFKKGYAAAEKQWGGELPDICKQTYDAFLEKMEEWKNSKNSTETKTEA